MSSGHFSSESSSHRSSCSSARRRREERRSRKDEKRRRARKAAKRERKERKRARKEDKKESSRYRRQHRGEPEEGGLGSSKYHHSWHEAHEAAAARMFDDSFEARLREEALAEADEGGFGWAEDLETAGQMSGDWFADVANQMEEMRAQRTANQENARYERLRKVRERRAEVEAERLRWQQAVLDEEEAEAKRREGVKKRRAADELKVAHEAYEARWRQFLQLGDELSMVDIPWPCDAPTAGASGDAQYAMKVAKVILPSGGGNIDAAARRKILQAEQRRWHPDKFIARWGAQLESTGRNAVLDRVKSVSQALNALMSDESLYASADGEVGPFPPPGHW